MQFAVVQRKALDQYASIGSSYRYSYINVYNYQRERFKEQLELAKKGDEEAMVLDEDFLRAIE